MSVRLESITLPHFICSVILKASSGRQAVGIEAQAEEFDVRVFVHIVQGMQDK